MIDKTQIFADGEQVVYIWKDGKAESSYTIKNPLITSMDINFGSIPDIPKTFGGIRVIKGFQPSFESVTLTTEIKAKPGDVITEYSANGGLLQKLDLFKNIPVSKMFKIINEKLKKREKTT